MKAINGINVTKKIKNIRRFLLGNKLDFEMENVVFNGIVIIIFIYLLCTSALNFFYEQHFLGVLLLLSCAVLASFYYNSRFKRNFKNSYIYFGLFSYPVIAINFFLNDGLGGPSVYVFLLFHIIILCLSPRKYYLFWLLYNVIVYIALVYINIFHPQMIPVLYFDSEHRFWDHMITYCFSVLAIFGIFSTMHEFYYQQKKETETKNRQLLEVNHLLSNSNEQKSKIIAVISHDLRSPLNSIVNILEFLQEGELDKAELIMVRNELFTMTSHTVKMLDNILEWAALEMQKKETNITTSDIKSACENVMVIFAILANHKQITFKTKYHDNPTVTTDMNRVILIIRNLVQNAIKFTPSGGEIVFSVEQVGEKVLLSVMDSGVGFSREKLDNLFVLDVQATYGTENEKGTGLGLYFSRENAEKIHAEISVETEEGKGSTITLTLPLNLDTFSATNT